MFQQSPVLKPAAKILSYEEPQPSGTKSEAKWSNIFAAINKVRSKLGIAFIIIGLISIQVLLTTWNFCFIVG